MLLSEEDMFSWVTEMAFEVYWRRFSTEPSVAASVETLLIAAWTRLTAWAQRSPGLLVSSCLFDQLVEARSLEVAYQTTG